MMAMHRRRCLASYLAAAAVLHAPLAEAQPQPWQICDAGSGNYTEGSAYQANIRLLAAVLPKNASSPALFAVGSVGATPDGVYALTLCRGDANASACAVCIATAFQGAQQLCALIKGVTIFYDLCLLRFSNRNFLASTNNDGGMTILWNYYTVSGQAAVALDAAVGLLINATADSVAANSSKRFATGEEAFDELYPTIYSLAQCTPDQGLKFR